MGNSNKKNKVQLPKCDRSSMKQRFALDAEFETEHFVKVLLLGNTEVGKTSIVKQLISGKMNINYEPSIGIDFYNHFVRHDGRKIKLQIWDTSGLPQYKSIREAYFRNTSFLLIIFDMSDISSINNLGQLIEDIKQDGYNKSIVLVGNKTDKHIDLLNRQKAKIIAEKKNLQLFEVSALTGVGIQELFDNLDYLKVIEIRQEPKVE
jgi:small GTP-binding protein